MSSSGEENFLDQIRFSETPERPSASVSQAIREHCTQDLVARRSLTRVQRTLLCAVPTMLVIASLALLWNGNGVHTITQGAILGAVGWSVVLLAILGFGVSDGLASRRWLRTLAAIFIPVAYLIYLAVESNTWLPLAGIGDHAHGTLTCGAMSLSLGAVTTLTVMLIWKRSDPFNPGLSGALLGFVGGLAGALSVHMVCPSREGWHLWLGHGLSVIFIAGLSVALGRKLLAP